MATPLVTPTGQKAQAEKKPMSEFLGVDVYASGGGLANDLAEAAEARRAAKDPTRAVKE